ncbi:MAG: excinuclease ABC subunit UvrC [Acidobacteriota bacterium]
MIERPSEPLPTRPGCYVFRDPKGRPLYVGKAKNLRARVGSYFHERPSPKVERLRRAASSLEVIVTPNEWEAFLLENNLIKQFRPRFNTLLKDDKTYPYIKLTMKDRFPKALFTRRPLRDGSLYFGPFVPGWKARQNLRLLQESFKIATCKDPLDGTRPRPCLFYEMGQCFAPCVKGKADPRSYGQAVGAARLFLEGHTSALREELEKKMREAASNREYESAAHYRDLLQATEALGAKQAVSRPGEGHWELFGLYGGGSDYRLHSFTLLDGRVVDRRVWRLEDVEGTEEEILSSSLMRLYGNSPGIPDGVCVPRDFADAALLSRFLSERKGRRVPVAVPRRGPKAALVANLVENARIDFEARADRSAAPRELALRLGLDGTPSRIECFDISHTHGGETVASCVVWEDGRMRREDYRRFNVKGVRGVDDFASIAEVVARRYARLLREGAPFPDLVVVDGGQGQVNAARSALESIVPECPALVGLAKREEWVYRPGTAEPLVLPKTSPALHLLQSVRDEAHRFALAGHRARRSRARLASPLMTIPGVGPITARKLLKAFLTTDAVRGASEEALASAVGKAAAARVLRWVRGEEGSKDRGIE